MKIKPRVRKSPKPPKAPASDVPPCLHLDLDKKCLWVDLGCLNWGVYQFTCYAKEVPLPVGLLWCHLFGAGQQGKKHRCEILMAWVPELFRRNGVATKMTQAIFEAGGCNVAVTQNGSDTGGLACLQATGWKLDEQTGMWVLTKEDFEQATKQR